MKQLLLCATFLLFAACKAPAPPAASASAPAEEPPASPAAPLETSSATAPAPVPPSFDCAKAASEAEKLVCGDAELAALDRQLAQRYAQAEKKDPAIERGWIKGRDECWKEDDARTCVLDAYRTRLVELAINAPGTVVPKAVEYRCSDNRNPFTMVFYNDLDPRAAVMTWGNDQAIVFPQPTGSGSKYGRKGIEYWEHQGEASVDFYGTKLTCTPTS